MLRLERQYYLRSVALQRFSSYLLPLWQNLPSGWRGLYVINCLHSMFRATSLSARAAPVYTVHSGPGRPRRWTWSQFSCVRRRYAVMSTVVMTTWCPPSGDLRTTSTNDVSHWMSANPLKLNADKTELFWAGSGHGPAVLGSSGPYLQLKTETVMAIDQVRVLGLERSRDRSSTLSTFVQRASTGLVSSDRSDVHSTWSLRPRWSTLSWRHASTIAMPFSRGHPSLPQTSSSELWMPLLASSPTRGSTIADSPICSTTNCTGSTFPSGCNTSCVQRFIAVCSTRRHTTWKIAASSLQILPVVSTCGPPAAISCL